MFLDSYSFTICDTSNFSEYVKGGVVTEVKQSEFLNFVSVTCYWFIPYLGFCCHDGQLVCFCKCVVLQTAL